MNKQTFFTGVFLSALLAPNVSTSQEKLQKPVQQKTSTILNPEYQPLGEYHGVEIYQYKDYVKGNLVLHKKFSSFINILKEQFSTQYILINYSVKIQDKASIYKFDIDTPSGITHSIYVVSVGENIFELKNLDLEGAKKESEIYL